MRRRLCFSLARQRSRAAPARCVRLPAGTGARCGARRHGRAHRRAQHRRAAALWRRAGCRSPAASMRPTALPTMSGRRRIARHAANHDGAEFGAAPAGRYRARQRRRHRRCGGYLCRDQYSGIRPGCDREISHCRRNWPRAPSRRRQTGSCEIHRQRAGGSTPEGIAAAMSTLWGQAADVVAGMI